MRLKTDTEESVSFKRRKTHFLTMNLIYVMLRQQLTLFLSLEMQSPQGQIIRPLVLALQRPKSFLCVTGPYRSQALADALKGPIGRMPAGMGTGVDGVGGITAGPGGWGEEDILCFLTHLLSFLANLSSPRFSLIL